MRYLYGENICFADSLISDWNQFSGILSKIFMGSLSTDIDTRMWFTKVEFSFGLTNGLNHADIKYMHFLYIKLILIPDMGVEVHALLLANGDKLVDILI